MFLLWALKNTSRFRLSRLLNWLNCCLMLLWRKIYVVIVLIFIHKYLYRLPNFPIYSLFSCSLPLSVKLHLPAYLLLGNFYYNVYYELRRSISVQIRPHILWPNRQQCKNGASRVIPQYSIVIKNISNNFSYIMKLFSDDKSFNDVMHVTMTL